MASAVKKFGNSAGLLIPKPLLAEFGAQAGDHVEMRVEDGRLVIEHVTAPRLGRGCEAPGRAGRRSAGLARIRQYR